jgi:hypothetical protein
MRQTCTRPCSTRQRDGEWRGQFADRALSGGQVAQHRAAGRVGQGVEHGVEAFGGLGFINHAVEYTPVNLTVNRLVK